MGIFIYCISTMFTNIYIWNICFNSWNKVWNWWILLKVIYCEVYEKRSKYREIYLYTINIGDGKDLTEIDWTTKRVLVEKFGNIDSGNTIFKYKKVSYTGSDTDITVNAIG